MSDSLLRDQISRHGTRHGDVSYVTLAIPDAARGRRFYGAVLGWTFGRGALDAEGNQADGVVPQVGLWPESEWQQGTHAGAILSWRVDDIARAVDGVRAGGGTASDPEELPYGLQSDCTDGNGLRFSLHELPPAGEPVGPNGGREGDISYIVLRVADLDLARGLFADVLGWSYSPGTSGVHVEGPAPMTGMSQGSPGASLCFRVDDISVALERVRAAGGRAAEVSSRPYGLESLCTDDQGVEFYLHQLS
jgi:predicted enzyme related to lactoylglutathione lyase